MASRRRASACASWIFRVAESGMPAASRSAGNGCREAPPTLNTARSRVKPSRISSAASRLARSFPIRSACSSRAGREPKAPQVSATTRSCLARSSTTSSPRARSAFPPARGSTAATSSVLRPCRIRIVRSASSPTGSKRTSWQRDRMVARSAVKVVVTRMKSDRPAGSSRVLRKALAAGSCIWSAGSRIQTLTFPSYARRLARAARSRTCSIVMTVFSCGVTRITSGC